MIVSNQILTVDLLREFLNYDKDSGVFTWRVTNSNRAVQGKSAGCYRRDGYGRCQIDGREYLLHRLAWLYIHGSWPNGVIDHINRNPRDNRIENLRDVSHSENRQNTLESAANRSGKKGVSRHKSGVWRAAIQAAGKSKHIGYFATLEQAAQAYATAAATAHTTNPKAARC